MGVLLIEMAKRANARGDKSASGLMGDGGKGPDDPKEEADESDSEAVKESAALDVARALGINEKDVDVEALSSALSDFCEAHAMSGGYKEGDRADEGEGD